MAAAQIKERAAALRAELEKNRETFNAMTMNAVKYVETLQKEIKENRGKTEGEKNFFCVKFLLC